MNLISAWESAFHSHRKLPSFSRQPADKWAGRGRPALPRFRPTIRRSRVLPGGLAATSVAQSPGLNGCTADACRRMQPATIP